jgi:WD40 repeat protein
MGRKRHTAEQIIWELRIAGVETEKLSLEGRVRSVDFSLDGNSIVSGSDDTLKISDAKTYRKKLTLKGHTGTANSVAFSPDGNSIVSGSSDDTLKIWDVSAFSSR